MDQLTNLDFVLIKMISNSKNKDCSFIIQSQEYPKLRKLFLDFFSDKNINVEKIKRIRKGIYIVDKYIIKIGKTHIPSNIDKIEELVNIYIRENFIFETDNQIIFLGIEIQDYIDSNEEISENEIYTIYKRLRDKGYIWIDASINNVKKLNNKLFIIDTDFIYKEKEANFFNESLLSQKFRYKYLKEKDTI